MVPTLSTKMMFFSLWYDSSCGSVFPAAYEEALRGDLRGLSSLMGEGGSSRPQARAWALAARCVRCFALPAPSDVPQPQELDGLIEHPEAAEPAVEALAHFGRRAVLELDLASLGECRRRLERLEPSPKAHLWSTLLEAYADALAGDGQKAQEAGAAVFAEATKAGAATLAVDATSLQALGAMVRGESHLGLSLSRRAARMAQTEHLWMPHYFASVALARARRLRWSTHLSHRITEACLRIAAPIWHGWLQWERVWAGSLRERDRPDSSHRSPISTAVDDAFEWLGGFPYHPGRGDDTYTKLCEAVAGSALHRGDVLAARAATSPAGDLSRVVPEVAEFVSGASAHIPAVLSGLAIAPCAGAFAESGPTVLVRKGLPARRILGFARPVQMAFLKPTSVHATRVDAIIAAIALAGSTGIDEAELFAQVYGFEFRKRLHGPTFKVQRHYTKDRVAGYGSIQTVDGRYKLHVEKEFAIVDPRCQRPFQDLVLRCMAQKEGSTAKELAEELKAPLRTVQTALRGLVEEGACSSHREGRGVHYEVEDTTFTEVTVG